MRKVLKIAVEWEYVIYIAPYPVPFHGVGPEALLRLKVSVPTVEPPPPPCYWDSVLMVRIPC